MRGLATKIAATVLGAHFVKVILPADALVRLADGFERVRHLGAASELAGLDGARQVLSASRCLPPEKCVVFQAGSLLPNMPEAELRVAPDTLVGFQLLGDERQWAAASGLVNGLTIRLESWPRRLEAFAIEVDGEIALNGIWIAATGAADLRSGTEWSGPSITRWHHRARHQDEFEREDRPPVRVMSDGHWAELLSSAQIDDDLVLRFRIASQARWVRAISPALVPPGQGGDETEQRRFGIAVIALSVGEHSIALDGSALTSGFYPIEGDAPRNWRWTDGNGLIVLDPVPSEQVFLLRFTNWHEMLEM